MIAEIIFLLGFTASLVFRLFYVSHFNFAFTIDQARDMLEIRQIAVGHNMAFIGPVTSLNGVFLGPFWFYFNLLPFLVGGGNPTSLAFWQVIFFHLSVLIFWSYFRKKNHPFSFWGSLFFLISPRLFETTTYSFNANTTPGFVLLTMILLFHILHTKKQPLTFLLGLLVGLTMQIEILFGALLLPLSLYWLFSKKIKRSFRFLIGFCLTLIPQILFEVKHGFAMSRVIIAEVSGHSDILGDKLTLGQRLVDRYDNYLGVLRSTLPFGRFSVWVFLIAVVLIVFLFLKRKISLRSKTLFLTSFSLLLISIVVFLLYPGRLKDWWTVGLSIPFILISALSFSLLFQSKKIIFRFAGLVFIVYFCFSVLTYYQSIIHQRLSQRSTDRALLLNQIDAIDLVYKQAGGKGFKVYDYSPAVYDYNYQYLFWWYGLKRYGYLPEAVTYQDNVPPYIENNAFYWHNARPATELTFLIIESDPNHLEKEKSWRANFNAFCSDKSILTGGIVVEALESCVPKK